MKVELFVLLTSIAIRFVGISIFKLASWQLGPRCVVKGHGVVSRAFSSWQFTLSNQCSQVGTIPKRPKTPLKAVVRISSAC